MIGTGTTTNLIIAQLSSRTWRLAGLTAAGGVLTTVGEVLESADRTWLRLRATQPAQHRRIPQRRSVVTRWERPCSLVEGFVVEVEQEVIHVLHCIGCRYDYANQSVLSIESI
jgi:hypothetical protein